jgi:hypothetical protein
VADTRGVTVLTVTRWTRYGKDRLYVSDEAGQRVGWLDLQTGESTIERSEMATEFCRAVGLAEPAGQAPVRAATEPASEDLAGQAPVLAATEPAWEDLAGQAPALAATEPAWEDLADRRAGQAARQQAIAELEAMRERGRVRAWVNRALDVKTDERAWRIGADGEETVGARLEKLTGRGWKVLHAVPVGDRGSDIDHVLIGPGGVYTLNTKHHPDKKIWVRGDTIKVGGYRVSYLHKSRYEADRASRLLSAAVGWPVPARPVTVFVTPRFAANLTIARQPDDVLVLDRLHIPASFKRSPRRVTTEQVEQLYEAARRSTTWCSTR